MQRQLENKVFWHFSAFLVGLLTIGWLWNDSLSHLLALVSNVDTYSHGLLVPFISLVLLWTRRNWLRRIDITTDWVGVLVLAVAVVLEKVGAVAEIRLLQHLAIVVAVHGLLLTFFGRSFFRLYLFPLMFLYLAVPVGESLIPMMQTLTAESVLKGLYLLGVPYQAEGVLITLSSGIYEVARACAGIKFFFASMVTGVLLAHLAYRRWIGRVMILIVAAVLPFAANALRVLAILLIAEYSDADFAKGIDHIVYGWGFFSVVLVILIAIAYKFSDAAVADEAVWEVDTTFRPFDLKQTLCRNGTFLAIALALVLITSQKVLPDHFSSTKIPAPLAPTCVNCGYRLIANNQISDMSVWKGAISEFHYLYRRSADKLMVSAALYCSQSRGNSMVQPENLKAGAGWSLLPGLKHEIVEIGNWRLTRQVYWKNTSRKVVFSGYFFDDRMYASQSKVKWQTAKSRLMKRGTAGAAFTITAPYMDYNNRDTFWVRNFLSTFPLEKFLWSSLDRAKGRRNSCVA